MITGNEPIHPATEYFHQVNGEMKRTLNPELADVDVVGSGITLRQYYAGLAMQGLTSLQDKGEFESTDESAKVCAELSIKYADALINALNKQP